MTRFYHSVNTKYNIHFNAEVAYKESLESKEKNREENLSDLLYIFPDNSDTTAISSSKGRFTTSIDKATKAIKLHSIKVKPKRDASRRNDKEYQDWIQQKEFTPFMDKVWMLLAKSEFHEGNYLRSISTFLYITNIYSTNPDIVAESQLWIARAYTEMGWLYEAGNVLHKLDVNKSIPNSQKNLYNVVKANYLVRNNELSPAVPYITEAIKKEKGIQKTRLKYLLGQLYAKLGDEVNAEKSFASVSGMNTPYLYTLNAKLQQLQSAKSKSKESILSSLNKMTKGEKNKEYLDQVYFAIGNVYLQNEDTTKAIESYTKAIEKSTRNGYEKALCQIALADIYFNKREFISAQPNYSDALSKLKKSHTAYPRVSLRSGVLDELVTHVKTLNEQDSLQHLAQLPEEERLKIINKKIQDLKKEEETRRKEEERQNRMDNGNVSSWDDLDNKQLFDTPSNTMKTPTIPNFGQKQWDDPNLFYFYNEQAVNQGKIAFQKQWGNRKLEDDWRRRNKVTAGLIDSNESEIEGMPTDSIQTADKKNVDGKTAPDDIYSVDFYLQQLPFSEKAIEESNVLIENALFNMGLIYKDKLADFDLSIDAFNTDINRFPNTPNLEEIYYQLLLIYMQNGNGGMMEQYRNKLLSEFTSGKYAIPLAEPDYEWNFRHMASLQDSIYSTTFQAYQNADVQTVRNNYQLIKTKYPFTDLMPKFAFINALSYAQSKDAISMSDNLAELVKEYPKADVTPMATEILNKLKDGQIILSDGSPITEFDWSKAYMGDSTLTGNKSKIIQYSDSLDTPYLLLLMFKPKTIDRNSLLYQVADYNFSNYVIQTFDLSFETFAPSQMLQIKGFNSFAAIKSYLNKGFMEEGLFHKLDSSILAVPISVENYTEILPRLGLDNYIGFFKTKYATQLPQLIAYWNKEKIEVIVDGANNKEAEIESNNTPIQDEKAKPKEEIIKAPAVPVIEKEEKEEKQEKTPPLQATNDKEINADDLLTKDQLEKIGKVKNVSDAIEDVMNNPVDGLKNLFDNYKNREKLTKEEKAELKEEEKIKKQELKKLKTIEKAEQDSIKKLEKIKADSIAKADKAALDSINNAQKEKQEEKKVEEERKKKAAKDAIDAKEAVRKEKENDRKEKEKLQKEKLRLREKERKEKEKQAELKRKQRTKK